MGFKGFGKSKLGGKDYGNQWKPVEGDNHIRILPPMLSLMDDEFGWHRYHGIHFGYHGVDSQDKNKTRVRPFRCIQDKKKGMVVQECPACEAIEKIEAEKKSTEAKLVAAGTAKDAIETELSPLAKWLKEHNCDRKMYMNVMRPDGEVGFFTVSYRTFKKLEEKLKDLAEKENLSAIDPEEGVWLNIKRTGKGIQSDDAVEIVQEDVKIDGRTLKDMKRAPLTEAQAEKALSECKDLDLVGTRLTYDQIAELISVGEVPEEVDRVFGDAAALLNGNKPATVPPKSAATAPTTPVAVAPKAPASVAKPAAPVATPAPAAKDPAIQARIDAIKARQAAAALAAAQAAAEAEAAAQAEAEALAAAEAESEAPAEAPATDEDYSGMEDEDFLKKFG